MRISYLELLTKELVLQRDFYSQVLELPVDLSTERLEVKAGTTTLAFTQAEPDFDGAYHFAFNIPENQFRAAKAWVAERLPLLRNEAGQDEYDFTNWNAHAFYFKDAAGNILEFIARHDLQIAVNAPFDSRQILQVSEIGLPSEDVVAFANNICSQLGLQLFRTDQPDREFTPIGDDNGLFILPVVGRLWLPTHTPGIPARLLPVRVKVNSNGRDWEVHGVPYEIINS
jgi:catechol 2,3-dioxygenase-like lactoylglutathione lyase family enzyme